ncbi:MAG: hypothetical protein IT281_02500 [Ignavibacteria bacterium]|nr:hypothetical protein [Ignavibacteria bacterium]
MTFKKDYVNYLLYTVINSSANGLKENYRLRKLVDSIMLIDDIMKVTYLIGKTAGLDMLFKYILYISDKIDKSQVTVFNLKDNFEYDRRNLEKICGKINQYRSESHDTIDIIEEESASVSTGDISGKLSEDEDGTDVNAEDSADNIMDIENTSGSGEDDSAESDDSKLTLIENVESYTGDAEVFELDSISESVENSGLEENNASTGDDDEKDEGFSNVDDAEIEEETDDTVGNDAENEVFELDDEDDIPEDLPELEIEVHKPVGASNEVEHIKEETITNEAYNKFETKFFEEVKILEKLFATIEKDCKTDDNGKLHEKCLQSLTEIIGISSELSNLSRQLSFDLIADIFLTMNIYFTKAISQPAILTGERIKLLDSSLALVNSLIKGEDYLNYDTIVDKMEAMKADLSRAPEKDYPLGEEIDVKDNYKEPEAEVQNNLSSEENVQVYKEANVSEDSTESTKIEFIPLVKKPALKQSQLDSAVFKLKYLIREFEKTFNAINNLKGEYSKFDAHEKISELNNALRLIAKISAIIKQQDVLKLAEVTYVFLKYVKDYRMDLQEAEIQQIIKYIIFTFKMLLTSRKPEDFNVLVQHLNNPVKIFADS